MEGRALSAALCFLVSFIVTASEGPQPPATTGGTVSQAPAAPALTPGSPAFDRYIHDHAVEIEVRNTDGRIVRKGAGVISSDSGYVMTSLDVVVGGTDYLIAGAAVQPPRSATALAVTKAGQLALLQLTGKPPALSTPARSASPPQPKDAVFGIPRPPLTEPDVRRGEISGIKTERDGSAILEVSFSSVAGTGLYNSRGALVAITRGSDKPRPSNRAVFVPDRMPGDWVLYFPARVGDPIARKPAAPPPQR
jgi:hypothetical protein